MNLFFFRPFGFAILHRLVICRVRREKRKKKNMRVFLASILLSATFDDDDDATSLPVEHNTTAGNGRNDEGDLLPLFLLQVTK